MAREGFDLNHVVVKLQFESQLYFFYLDPFSQETTRRNLLPVAMGGSNPSPAVLGRGGEQWRGRPLHLHDLDSDNVDDQDVLAATTAGGDVGSGGSGSAWTPPSKLGFDFFFCIFHFLHAGNITDCMRNLQFYKLNRKNAHTLQQVKIFLDHYTLYSLVLAKISFLPSISVPAQSAISVRLACLSLVQFTSGAIGPVGVHKWSYRSSWHSRLSSSTSRR